MRKIDVRRRLMHVDEFHLRNSKVPPIVHHHYPCTNAMHHPCTDVMHGPACPSSQNQIRPLLTYRHQDYMILLPCLSLFECLVSMFLSFGIPVSVFGMKNWRNLLGFEEDGEKVGPLFYCSFSYTTILLQLRVPWTARQKLYMMMLL